MSDDYVYEFVCCDELRESLKELLISLSGRSINQSVTALRSPDTITNSPLVLIVFPALMAAYSSIQTIT
jgi:hypothetical protein